MRAEGKLVYDSKGVVAIFRNPQSAADFVAQQTRLNQLETAIQETIESLPRTYVLTLRTLRAALGK